MAEGTSLTLEQQQRAEALAFVCQHFALPGGLAGLGRERLPIEAANPVIALAEWILESRGTVAAEPPASIAEPVAEAPNGTQANPFIAGDSFFTARGEERYEWWVDQAARPFTPTHPSKPVLQAWHGDDPVELRADDAKPTPQVTTTHALTDSQRAQNQWAATQALASGRISVEEVGAVVKGLHDASIYRMVAGE